MQKSIHDIDPDLSFVDLNRTGGFDGNSFKPDIRSPEEAAEYIRKLRQILRYLQTCDGNIEGSSSRWEYFCVQAREYEKYKLSNVSQLGTRCEVKI